MYLGEWSDSVEKTTLYSNMYSIREGGTLVAIGECYMTQTEGRGVPVWLASCSLVVCCGTRTDSWGGPECPTGTVGGQPWTRTHDSQVSHRTWRQAYVWCDLGFIHPLPFKRETKTLCPVGGAAEFDREGDLPALRWWQALFCQFLVWSHVLSLFLWYHEEAYNGWVIVVSVRTPQRLGWVTKKMAARGARSVWMYSCLVSQNGASAWHGSSARFKRTDEAVRQNLGFVPTLWKYEGRDAGYSAERMRTRHRPVMLDCNQQRVVGFKDLEIYREVTSASGRAFSPACVVSKNFHSIHRALLVSWMKT